MGIGYKRDSMSFRAGSRIHKSRTPMDVEAEADLYQLRFQTTSCCWSSRQRLWKDQITIELNEDNVHAKRIGT
ncbi:hypothetical protein V3C99_018590 [Haemonchus contortus]